MHTILLNRKVKLLGSRDEVESPFVGKEGRVVGAAQAPSGNLRLAVDFGDRVLSVPVDNLQLLPIDAP